MNVQISVNMSLMWKLNMSLSSVWSSLLLCMFALVVLKSQHGKKNILLVILTHLVGNIKALVCHVRASPTESQRAAL